MTTINQNNNSLAFGAIRVKKLDSVLSEIGAEVKIYHNLLPKTFCSLARIEKNNKMLFYTNKTHKKSILVIAKLFVTGTLNPKRNIAKGKKIIATVLNKGDKIVDSQGKTIAIV